MLQRPHLYVRHTSTAPSAHTGPLSVSTAAIAHTVFEEEGGECGVRILVVDDDRNVAETVRRMMVAEGWVVDVVHDGALGLEKAASERFDVIVLDIMMPGEDGLSLCRHIRETSEIPVILLTAKVQVLESWHEVPGVVDDHRPRKNGFRRDNCMGHADERSRAATSMSGRRPRVLPGQQVG